MFYGKGGYDWDTVYNMPVWLRRLTFNYIKEHYDKEKEEYDKQSRKLDNNSTPSAIARPPIPQKPTYTAKAPKK